MSILIESEHIWAGICWVGRHQPKVNLRQIFYCIVSCIGLLEVLRFARRPAFTLLTFVQRKLPNVQLVLSFRFLWPSFTIVDASLNERNCQLCNGDLEKTRCWARVSLCNIWSGWSQRGTGVEARQGVCIQILILLTYDEVVACGSITLQSKTVWGRYLSVVSNKKYRK